MKKNILFLALLLSLLFTILNLFPFVTTIRANGTGTRAQPYVPYTDVVSLVCSPDRPTILPGETVVLEAWTNVSNPESLQYTWNIKEGKLIGSGAKVTWDSTGVMPGTYRASVKGIPPRGFEGSCSLKIVVLSPETKGLEKGWSLLRSGNREEPGYGLYSYLLLPAQSPFASAPKLPELYLNALKVYASIADSVQCLERSGIPHSDLNMTYMPVMRLPSEDRPTPEWLLENYDFARARAILKLFHIDLEKNTGPFIVSGLSPLAGDKFTGNYLFQDLSASYGQSQLTLGWVKAFMNQAAQVSRWEPKNTERLALQLKIVIRQLGIQPNALNDCIRWETIFK